MMRKCNSFQFYLTFPPQYSVQCYCGDNYPNRNRYPRVSDGDCNKGCIGFVSEKCGSDWRQSVYRGTIIDQA